MSSCDVSWNKMLWLEAIVQIDENTAYASCSEFNALFQVDLRSGNCTYVDLFPNENITGQRLYIKALCVNEKIYFIPASASHISIYDLKEKNFQSVPLQNKFENVQYNKKYKFADAFVYKGYICILPATYPAVIKLSLRENNLEYFYDNMPDSEFFFRPGAVMLDNALLVSNTKDNAILEFNMETNETKIHHIGKRNHGSWSLVKDENCLWLIPKQQGAFVKWDYIHGNIDEYHRYPKDYKQSDFCFSKGYKCGEYIYAIPAKANMFVKVTGNGEIVKNDIVQLQSWDIVTYMFELGNYVYFFILHEAQKEYFRFNKEENIVEEWGFRFEGGAEKYVCDYFSRETNLLNENTIYKETEICGFRAFKDILSKGALGCGEKRDNDCVIGEKIYQRIL